MNPNKRYSAEQALQSDWFKQEPYSTPPSLHSIPPSHDYGQRQLKKRQKQQQPKARYEYSYNTNTMPKDDSVTPTTNPTVVKLQAPSFNNVQNTSQNQNNANNSGQSHTFYSKFKKPDQLKNRSRF